VDCECYGFPCQGKKVTIFIEDVEAHFKHAKFSRLTIVEDLHETEYGELQYGAEDLDGHHWLFSRRAKDVNPEQQGAKVTRAMIREDS